MPTPSLILVPARFKTGKLYTPVATTSGGVVLGASGDFNVTRALNTATRVNASGLIESVASGIPRLDYYTSGGTAGCPALLVEPSAQNLALQSQTLDVSGTWVRENGALVSANATGTTAPDGLNTAEILTLVSGSPVPALYQTIAMASGTTYTASIFLKNIALTSGQTFNFSTANQDTTTNQINCTIDLANATITSAVVGAGVTVSNVALDNYGNGWYRARFTFSFAVGRSDARLRIRATASASYNASFYVWGAQFETGSVATSYIPTTTGSVTRNADVISLSGAVSGCIGQTEGTIYAEVDIRSFTNSARIIGLSDGTGLNAIPIQLLVEGVSNYIRVPINASSSGQTDIIASMSTGINKIALGYAQNNVALYLNGTSVGTDTSCNIPATNKVDLGSLNGGTFFNNRIRAVALYTTRLTNAQLQALTT